MLVITSSATQAKHPQYNNSNSSPGMPPRGETMSTSTRTLHKENYYITNSDRRRRSSKTPPKSAYWPSMAARNTCNLHRRSFFKGKRKTTLSIRGPGRSSRVGNGRRRSRSTQKMVRSSRFFYITLSLTPLNSHGQQSHRRLGFMVRPIYVHLGLCMLPFYHTCFLLFGPGWYRRCPGFQCTEPAQVISSSTATSIQQREAQRGGRSAGASRED